MWFVVAIFLHSGLPGSCANNKTSDEFAVKSYPRVSYGRKTQYNVSGTVAETGLPVRTNTMPQFWVAYDYSETGVVERNVAFESFFHASCDAEETVPVTSISRHPPACARLREGRTR